LRAVFQTVDEKPGDVKEEPVSMPRTYRNEIAAFQIDRLLRFDLVPATVERTIEGKTGSLQIWLESAVDEKLLETYDMTELFDGTENQLILAEAFMALVDVVAPHSSVGLMLLPREKKLQVADSTKAFSTSPKPNPDLMTPPCGPFPPDLVLFWDAITPQDVEDKMRGYLSSEQIDALVRRGQAIMDACSGTDAPSEPAN